LGGYVLVLLLSIMDAFGGEFSTLASAIALLAATYIVLSEYLPIFEILGAFINNLRGKGTPGSSPNAGLPLAPGATYPEHQH
jgi:hypothetical protein